MYEIAVAVMAVFAVWGIIDIISGALSRILSTSSCDRIVIYVKSDKARLEGVVRSLMLKNPTAEIVIVEEDAKDELRTVIDKLCRDFAKIHMGRLK